MSGEESLAQVYREIESPKLPNLKKAGLVIFIYSLVFTSLVSFFAVMIIPDGVRQGFLENLIGGLAMNLAGPLPIRLIFHAFVVVVGAVILAGAVNTAIVGSNGVLNRVSEDGVLSDWFRQPHPRFGTSYRIINIIVLLQIVTIVISRGDVTFLANLNAFGVIWSFPLNCLAVLVSNQFNLYHLANVLDRVKPGRRDVVVLHVRLLRRAASGEYELEAEQLFGSIEQQLFSQALSLAEKRGKSIRLAVVAANDLWDGILRAATSLQSSTIVAGRSSRVSTEEHARLVGEAWEMIGDTKPKFNLEVHMPNGDKLYKLLGPHAPNLTANESNLLHRLCLRFVAVVSPLAPVSWSSGSLAERPGTPRKRQSES